MLDITDLVIECRNGNREAFSQIYDNFSLKAMRTAYLISGRKELAEEIVQESFVQCYKNIKKLKNPETFTSWFFKLLTRISWRYIKKEKPHLSYLSIEEDPGRLFPQDGSYSFGEAFELKEIINKALYRLDVTLRTTVILYYFNELTVKEIGRITGSFEGTVKSRLHKARKLLRLELAAKVDNRNAVYSNINEGKCKNNAKPGTA